MTEHIRTERLRTPDGLVIAARIAGPEDGPVAVLLPGWPQTAYAWRHVQSLLAAAGLRTIALDPPGLGDSGFLLDGDPYDTRSVARLLANAVSSLGLSRYVLVGHDVGTWIAYAWARDRAEAVSRLCLSEAALPGVTPPQAFAVEHAPKVFQFYLNAVPELPELLTRGKEREFLAWLFRTKSSVADAIGPDDLDEYMRSYGDPRRMQAGFAYYRAVPEDLTQNAQNRLPPMPILALGGEKGVGTALLDALRARRADVDGGVIAGAGHYLPEEAPDAFCARLLAFIRQGAGS